MREREKESGRGERERKTKRKRRGREKGIVLDPIQRGLVELTAITVPFTITGSHCLGGKTQTDHFFISEPFLLYLLTVLQ